MINRETIQLITDTAEIVDVVSDFVSLKRRGANYLGLCPFHNEKTPSFTVSAAKGLYKCFGCGKSGQPVNFIMEHEQLSYPDALRFLARKYGIEIKEEAPDPEYLKAESERESLMEVTRFAGELFQNQLWQNEEGKLIGLSYFTERGFSHETIKKFQLGFSLQNRKAFSDAALAAGYQKEYLVKTGLTIEKEDRYFDRFSSRVMFPILNLSGRVIGFGGRILGADKTQAKYLNSPESDIYHKSQVLYGLYQARKSIVENDTCYLVEGYTDVISLHQAGIENVVASSGTSLTLEQIRLIRRFTRNVTILYDGDNAGIKASLRGIDLVLSEGLNVRVLLFPDGEDPDSFARKTPTSELKEFIKNNPVDFISFKTGLLLKDTEGDPIKKSALLHEITGSIALIPDSFTRALYLKECSRILQVEEQLLQTELNKLLRKNRLKAAGADFAEENIQSEQVQAPNQTVQNSVNLTDTETQEQELVRLIVNYHDADIDVDLDENDAGHNQTVKMNFTDWVIAALNNYQLQIENDVNKAILNGFTEMRQQNSTNSPQFEGEQAHLSEKISGYKVNRYEVSPIWDEKFRVIVPRLDHDIKLHAEELIHRLQEKKLMSMLLETDQKIKDCTDPDELNRLLMLKIKLDQTKINLMKHKGNVIFF